MLESQAKNLHEVEALAVFKGPGSFTGLRIGLSVANALTTSLNIPIIAETGNNWIEKAVEKLEQGENEQIAFPEYGSPPHITAPKK